MTGLLPERPESGGAFDPAQLHLALDGAVGQAHAYSPMVTNPKGPAPAIGERIKDTKLGMALRHLPRGFAVANQVWIWDAFLALTRSVTLQALRGNDHPHRGHGKRRRRGLIVVPARVVRLAPEQQNGPFLSAYRPCAPCLLRLGKGRPPAIRLRPLHREGGVPTRLGEVIPHQSIPPLQPSVF